MPAIQDKTVWSPYFGWCEGRFIDGGRGWQAVSVAGIRWCEAWGEQPHWGNPALAAEGLLNRAEMEAGFALTGTVRHAEAAG